MELLTRNKVDKRPHTLRYVARVRVQKDKRAPGTAEGAQHFTQLAAFQCLLHRETVGLHQACTVFDQCHCAQVIIQAGAVT